MGRTDKTVNNIKYGMLSSVILTVLKFMTRTVMIYTLGIQYVGIDGLFASVIGILNLSELGISNAINYSLYRPVAEKDYIRANNIINFYKEIYFLIGCIIALVGVGMLPFLEVFINGEIPQEQNIYLLYLLTLINTSLGYFLFAYKNSIFIANLQNKEISNVKTFTSLLQNIVQIICLYTWKSYLIYLCFAPIFTVVNNLLLSKRAKKMFPEYFAEGRLCKEEKSAILANVKGLIIQKIGSVVFNSVDSIVISMYLGLSMVAVYNNYFYIIQFLWILLGVIESTLIASVGNSIAVEDRLKNKRDFYRFNFIYIWIVSVTSSCLLCGYQPFMEIWVGQDLMLSEVMVVLFAIYYYVCKMGTMGYIYKEAAGIWTKGKYIPAISAVVNLGMNIILTQRVGLPGILISSIISMGSVNLFGYLYVVFKNYLGTTSEWAKYMITQYLYLFINLGVAYMAFKIVEKIGMGGILGFITSVIFSFFWQNVMMILIYHNTDGFAESFIFIKKSIRWYLKEKR